MTPVFSNDQIEAENREHEALTSLDHLKTYLEEKGCFTKWALHEEIKPTIAVRALTYPQLMSDIECPRIYLDYTALDASKNDFVIIELKDAVIESVMAVDVLPFIAEFHANFLKDFLQEQFGDNVPELTTDMVIQNVILTALQSVFNDRSQFAVVVLTRLLMSWYPNANDLAVVVQEVETSETSDKNTVLRLVGIGSLKDKEPVTLN